MAGKTISIKGMELEPNDRQAAIVTSVYDDGSYSLDLTSKILTSEKYEEMLFDEPIQPYSIIPKVGPFKNILGDVNKKLKVVGFLGFHYKRCFWMIHCKRCKKYSIREHSVWVKKKRRCSGFTKNSY